MDKFTLTVEGITREEYFQACRESGRRLYGILAVSMIVICGAIILATGNAGLSAFLGPLVVYVLAIGVYEVMTHVTYKDQLAKIDPPVEYEFSALRWIVRKGDAPVEVDWRKTPKLHKSRDCIFLYNSDASGNLLPRRLLTREQITLLDKWYKSTRQSAADYAKEHERQERQAFRDSHQHLRLGNSGPMWGPWKRKK